MTFVHQQQKIRRKIIQQTEGPLPGISAVHVAGVVFDPRTIPELSDHFHIEGDPIFDAPGFFNFAFFLEMSHLTDHILLDFQKNIAELMARCHIIGGGEQREMIQGIAGTPTDGIEVVVGLDAMPIPANSVSKIGVGRENIHDLTPDPEGSAGQFMQRSGIHDVHQLVHQSFLGHGFARSKADHLVGIICRITHAVDAGYRGHDQHIATTRHQGRGGP